MTSTLEIVSTGESCPSFSGESIIVIRVAKGSGAGTITLPKDLDVMSILPSVRGEPQVEGQVFTAPEDSKAGDKFFLLGHYGKPAGSP